MKICNSCNYAHNHAGNVRCQQCHAPLARSAWKQIRAGMMHQSHPTDHEKEALGLIHKTYGEGTYSTEYLALNQDDQPSTEQYIAIGMGPHERPDPAPDGC